MLLPGLGQGLVWRALLDCLAPPSAFSSPCTPEPQSSWARLLLPQGGCFHKGLVCCGGALSGPLPWSVSTINSTCGPGPWRWAFLSLLRCISVICLAENLTCDSSSRNSRPLLEMAAEFWTRYGFLSPSQIQKFFSRQNWPLPVSWVTGLYTLIQKQRKFCFSIPFLELIFNSPWELIDCCRYPRI